MPSKPAGDSGSKQTVTSQTSLPQWVDTAAQSTLAQAQDTSQNLMGPYTGQRVATLNPGEQSGIQGLWDSQGYGASQFNAAQSAANIGTQYQPGQVNPGFLSGTDLSPYMNPYTQDVINPSMQLLDQQRQMGNNQTADLASKTGAFGGSRQGVAEGVNNAQSALLGGQLGAQLNSANFLNAQGQATNDLNRSLTAQQSNQQAGLAGAAQRLNAANSLGALTQTASQDNLARMQAAMGGQGMLQQQNQQQLSATQQQYDEQRQQPIDQLQILLSALKGVPYGQTQTQTGPGPTYNPGMQALGGLGTLAGIAGSVIPLFSDAREKTDKKKLGKDPATGLTMWAYRYKDDPKTYPKVVGPMAQEVEEKFPGSVIEIGGKKVINLGFGG